MLLLIFLVVLLSCLNALADVGQVQIQDSQEENNFLVQRKRRVPVHRSSLIPKTFMFLNREIKQPGSLDFCETTQEPEFT